MQVFLIDNGTRLFDATICREKYGALADSVDVAGTLWPHPEFTPTGSALLPLIDGAINEVESLPTATEESKHLLNWLSKYRLACTSYPSARLEVIPDPPKAEEVQK